MRSFLIPVLLFAGLTGCRKEVIIPKQPVKEPFFLTGQLPPVVYQKNPLFEARYFANIPLFIKYGSDLQQRVTLKLLDVPAGITSQFETAQGFPDFNSVLSLEDKGVANGNYIVQLILENDTGKQKKYPIPVMVKGDTSCIGFFAGREFRVLRKPFLGDSEYGDTVTKGERDATYPEMLLLQGYKSNTALRLLLNCKDQKVTLPAQVVADSLYEGTGKISYTLNPFQVQMVMRVYTNAVGSNTFYSQEVTIQLLDEKE